jgi:hypothetical protein
MAAIKISFPVSRAVIYPSVVRLASQFGDAFTPATEETNVNSLSLDSKTVDAKLIKKIKKLWAMVKPIKHAALTIGDDKAYLFEGEIDRVIRCMGRRDYAEDADAYCNGADGKPSHTFGCRELHGVSSSPGIPRRVLGLINYGLHDGNVIDPENDVWNTPMGGLPFSLYGMKTKKGWSFDVKAIQDKARKMAKGRACQVCPHFDWQRVDREIELRCVTASVTFSTMNDLEVFGIKQERQED